MQNLSGVGNERLRPRAISPSGRAATAHGGAARAAVHPASTPSYKQRNAVERAINKLMGFRAIATRYDKRDFTFRATIDVATIRIWLRDPVPR